MTDLHNAIFRWPHTDATSVILTGTFDQWSSSINLTKCPSGFEGTVKIPYEDKVLYKFVVDGQWFVHDDQPTEADHVGNINNVYIAPKKPAMLAPEEGESTSQIANFIAETPSHPDTTISVPAATASMTSHVEQIHEGDVDPDSARALESVNGPTVLEGAKAAFERLTYGTATTHVSAAPKDDTIGETFGATFPQLVTDFADTIAARDGANSTLGYVASGLGAAIQSFVGVDPINADKIAYKSPVPGAQFEKPEVKIEEGEGPTGDAEAPTEKPTEEPELSTGKAEGLTEEAKGPREEAEAPTEETETLTEEAEGPTEDSEAHSLTKKLEIPTEKPTEEPELPMGRAEGLMEEAEGPTEEAEASIEGTETLTEEAEGLTEDSEANSLTKELEAATEKPTEEPELPTEARGLTEEPEVPKEVPPIYKPGFFGNTVPTPIAPIDGSSNITPKLTQVPVSIPSAIDTTLTSPMPSETPVSIPVLSTPVIIAPSEPESPAPSTTAAEPEAITTAVGTAQEALGDNNKTDIAITAIQSDLPSGPTDVDTLPEELSTHIPLKIASPNPESAALAMAVHGPNNLNGVLLELASPERTHQPAGPTANLDPEPIAAESTFTTLVPTLATGPEPNVSADRAVPGDNAVISIVDASTPATQSEAPAVSMEELSTHTHVNIIPSEPKSVTPILTVPAAEPSLSTTYSPEPAAPCEPEPIAADNANATASEGKPSPTVLPETPSEAPASAEVAPPASEELLTQAYVNIAEPKQVPLASALEVSVPEPTAPHTSEPEVVAAGDSAVLPPSASSIATATSDSKLGSPSPKAVTDGTTTMTKSTLASKPSTPIEKQEFPSSGPPGSATTSTLSSKVGTTSSRKKKSSIFGKLKHIFSKDEKEKGRS